MVVGFGHDLFQLGNRLRRADTGNYVFALRVYQELAVEHFFSCGRVARESYARAGVVAHVAEHHCLYVRGGADGVRNLFHAAVVDGFGRVPGIKHRIAGEQQLLQRILRKVLARFFFDELFVIGNDRF